MLSRVIAQTFQIKTSVPFASHITYFISASIQTFILSFIISCIKGRTLDVELSCYNYGCWQTVRGRFEYSLFYFMMLQAEIIVCCSVSVQTNSLLDESK